MRIHHHKTNGGKRRRAITLLETLTVISIIGVLIAMLLPALQNARESARRAECANNLIQLIIAVNHYETSHRSFPPGSIEKKGPIVNAANPASYHHNWLSHTLPYFEESIAYRNIDFRVSVYHPKNAPVAAILPSVLHCSSASWPMGDSCYAAVHHDVEAPIDVGNNGVFFLNSHVRLKEVSDGMSNTIFLGEKWVDNVDFGWLSGTRSTLRNAGTSFLDGRYRAGPPVWGGTLAEVGGFASAHLEGVQFAFGDGSVRFLHDSVDLKLLQQLAHRCDGQLPIQPGLP